ncbi:spindle and centriole-associated protein 1 [Salarias fasciatus]|uniref:Spindle and centriole-associated protein 1 n=1 Tax=Salarias fasciatus TaxID=181472 RepID=A0A672G8R1_SALFA|nr:spindle and centriole-associated protein 1 [Salarias fasciatus]
MSFVRVGRPQQHSKGKRPVRPKKAAATRRDWVSTVNDLSVHKLTPAELSHRHEIHKSHNQAAAQWELKEKALKRHLRHGGSPVHLDKASLSIIREVFSDQLLLQDVLARSDRAMAMVKDIFGDAPRRQTGHPSVTVAPDCDSDSELPVLQRPDPPTQLSLLSQSMMDQEALNEVDLSDAHPDSPDCRVVRRVNLRKFKGRPRGRTVQQQLIQHPNYHRDDDPVTPSSSGRIPDRAALNATVAVRRIRSKNSNSDDSKDEISSMVSQVLNPERLNQTDKSTSHRSRNCVSGSSELDGSSAGGNQSGLGLLQALLHQVEADLDSLSPETAQNPKEHRTQGLTGFSAALISTLGRLVHLLKQREDENRKEAEERRRLEKELSEQRALIDALTAETMTLREETASLQAELQQRTSELEEKLDSVVLVMGGLGLLGQHSDASQVLDVSAAECHSAPVAERGPRQPQVLVSPAILLSPPCQSDKRQHNSASYPVQQQQLPPLAPQHSSEDARAHGSASSLNSLQPPRRPSASSLSLSSDRLHPRLSPEAMLAEISELSRQTDAIRAQLSQARGVSPEAGGSLSSGSEQRRSGSSSTGRGASQRTVTPEEPRTPQAATPLLSVEQRLLELNRQNAAARGRLLELIEQQKQSVSVKVSPSVSPIPPSAFSPEAAAGKSSIEDVSLLQSAGSELSPHRFGAQRIEGKSQMNRQKQQEGWFSLSAHVR